MNSQPVLILLTVALAWADPQGLLIRGEVSEVTQVGSDLDSLDSLEVDSVSSEDVGRMGVADSDSGETVDRLGLHRESSGGSGEDLGRGMFDWNRARSRNNKHKHHKGNHPKYHHYDKKYDKDPGWGWQDKHHHHHHHHRPAWGWGHSHKPHYVKYWEQNHNPHNHGPKRKKKGWKMVKQSPFAPGYLADLAERIADGVGFLPEYGWEKKKNVGWHKHGKYTFKGITLHNGFFTEVL